MREEDLLPYYSLLAAIRAGVATNQERRQAALLARELQRDFYGDLDGLAEGEFIEQIGINTVMTIAEARRLASA